MKLVSMQFISLDGVYQGPGSLDEDRSDGFERGGWLVPFVDDAFEAAVSRWGEEVDGYLFGRRTYEAFAAFWPTVTDPSDRAAARLNGLPKYVATRAGVTASWQPATILKGDVERQVAELKQRPGRELQIHGSGSLALSMLRAGLVDEWRLVTAPVVVGAGHRLFGDTAATLGFELIGETRTPKGLLLQSLRYAGPHAAGTYHRG